MVDETLKLLDKALEIYDLDHLLLTSDHGYILDKNNWNLPRNPAFEGMDRHTVLNELSKESVEVFAALRKEGRAVSVGRHGLLASRHQRRVGPRKIGFHGGASLAELLVPQVALRRS